MGDANTFMKSLEVTNRLSYVNKDEKSIELRKSIYGLYGDLAQFIMFPDDFIVGLVENNIETYRVVCSETVCNIMLSQIDKDSEVYTGNSSFTQHFKDAKEGYIIIKKASDKLGFDTSKVYSVSEILNALSKFKYGEFKPSKPVAKVTTEKSEFESLLDGISESLLLHGVRIALSTFTDSDKREIFEGFTEAGKEKYHKYMKLRSV